MQVIGFCNKWVFAAHFQSLRLQCFEVLPVYAFPSTRVKIKNQTVMIEYLKIDWHISSICYGFYFIFTVNESIAFGQNLSSSPDLQKSKVCLYEIP